MDGLAFYRLTQIPQNTKKRKVKPKVEEHNLENEIGVEYYCPNCNQPNIVNSVCTIQCKKCDWRILEKGRQSIVTIKAV